MACVHLTSYIHVEINVLNIKKINTEIFKYLNK